MSASPDQISAAAKALQTMVDHEINSIPVFAQGMARQALNAQVIGRFAKAAADAVVAVKEV